MTVASETFINFDPHKVPSPCFVVDEYALKKNLETLAYVQSESGAKILLALKAFAMPSIAPMAKHYLSGTCASGLHEAQQGREFFGGEVHTFSAAFKESELTSILDISDHVVFNSYGQWQRFQPLIERAKRSRPHLKFGLRLNPLHSEGNTPIYDPCAPGSRLGIPVNQFDDIDFSGISGIHFHTLCEQNFAPLERTLTVIENQFSDRLLQ